MMRRLLSLGLLLAACAAPDARIADTSRSDPACRAELQGGLEAFRRDLGLDIQIDPAAIDTLLAAGALERGYARDGTRFTADFGLFRQGDACALRLYAMSTATPGSTTTRTGDFGTLPLTACACIDAPK